MRHWRTLPQHGFVWLSLLWSLRVNCYIQQYEIYFTTFHWSFRFLLDSCCSTAHCAGEPLSFSVGFITETNYYYFDNPNKVDLKVFYDDSVFVNVLKQDYPDMDSTTISFYWDVDTSVDHYTILANDTLLGKLNLTYGMTERSCCGSESITKDLKFESDQRYSKEFGFQIIL